MLDVGSCNKIVQLKQSFLVQHVIEISLRSNDVIIGISLALPLIVSVESCIILLKPGALFLHSSSRCNASFNKPRYSKNNPFI
jgi:phosphohistidine swiveling domain-containing protein